MVHHLFVSSAKLFCIFLKLTTDPANPTVTIGQLRTSLMGYEQLHADQIYTEYTIYKCMCDAPWLHHLESQFLKMWFVITLLKTCYFLSFTGKNINFGSTLLPNISQYFTDLYVVDISFNRSVTENSVHHLVSYHYITEYVF